MPVLLTAHVGVDLFFVVSGLCLAYPVLLRQSRNDKLGLNALNYASRRIVRIYPPFLVALALFISWSAFPSWHKLEAARWVAPNISALSTLREALLIDGGPLHNGSFYTLAIEMRWYVLFPIALLLFTRWPAALVPLAVAAWIVHYVGFHASRDAIMFPAFLFGIYCARLATMRVKTWLPWVALVMACALAFWSPLRSDEPIWEVVAFAFVACAVSTAWLQKILSNGPLVAVGIASYSIYLIHQPIVLEFETSGAPYYVAGAVALAAGYTFWWLIERPLLSQSFRKPAIRLVEKALDSCAQQLMRLLGFKREQIGWSGGSTDAPSARTV